MNLDRISIAYFMSKYIKPLIKDGKLGLQFPDKPKSKNQKYYIGG